MDTKMNKILKSTALAAMISAAPLSVLAETSERDLATEEATVRWSSNSMTSSSTSITSQPAM